MLTSARAASPARARPVAAVAAAAPLILIVVAGAVLRLWAFSRVPGNAYYDAAARSMTLSWHNLFFGAFEPGGQVSIDKAPADLWLQVASVKLFGFTPTAVRLPEVVAGILAIPVLYDLVRRISGRTAGLAAAAALAVLPAAILTAHSDTMDSVMMLLDVVAAWLVVAGARARRGWPIVAAGAVLGVAFNVKLFEALIFAPALALLMLLVVDGPIRRRVLVLGGSLVAFVAVSLSWIVTASLTPLSGRPWPIGSTDGSIWSVIFGFNGLDRLRTPATPAALALDPPGALRFFRSAGHGYAWTVGTVLLAALVLGVVALAVAVATRRGRPAADRVRIAGIAFFGAWLVLGIALLSHMQRMQPRYLDAVTPAIAAVLGLGLAWLASAGTSRWRALPLVAAGAAVAVGAAVLGSAPAWAVVIAGLGVLGLVVVGLGGVAGPARASALALCALAAVLAVPAAGAVSVARDHASDAGIANPIKPAHVVLLSRYLRAHQGSATYEVVSPTVMLASPLIVRDARPVLMLTSLHGRPLLTPAQLRELVATGKVRYSLGPGGSAPVARWARAHAKDVSAAAGLPHGSLYRLSTTPTARAGR